MVVGKSGIAGMKVFGKKWDRGIGKSVGSGLLVLGKGKNYFFRKWRFW